MGLSKEAQSNRMCYKEAQSRMNVLQQYQDSVIEEAQSRMNRLEKEAQSRINVLQQAQDVRATEKGNEE